MVLAFERALQELQHGQTGTDATEALHIQLMQLPGEATALTFSEASRQALPLESGPAVRLALRAPAVQWELGHSQETQALLEAEVSASACCLAVQVRSHTLRVCMIPTPFIYDA